MNTKVHSLLENFVQQELTAIGIDPSYSWSDARAEIEFILSNDEGNIIPVEVKAANGLALNP